MKPIFKRTFQQQINLITSLKIVEYLQSVAKNQDFAVLISRPAPSFSFSRQFKSQQQQQHQQQQQQQLQQQQQQLLLRRLP